jgi:hypothetical protein
LSCKFSVNERSRHSCSNESLFWGIWFLWVGDQDFITYCSLPGRLSWSYAQENIRRFFERVTGMNNQW